MVAELGSQRGDGFVELLLRSIVRVHVSGNLGELPEPLGPKPPAAGRVSESQGQVQHRQPAGTSMLERGPERLNIVASFGFEERGDPAVNRMSSRCRELAGGGRPDQVMGERHATGQTYREAPADELGGWLLRPEAQASPPGARARRSRTVWRPP